MKLAKRGDGNAAETAPLEEKPKTGKQRREAVVVYMSVLFAAVLLLILLSYTMQQRRNEDAMSALNEQHSQFSTQALQNIEALQTKTLELQAELDKLLRENTDAEKEREELTEQLEQLQAELEQEQKTREELEAELDKSAAANEARRQFFIDYHNILAQDEPDEEALTRMEGAREYFDGAYQELYETIMTEIKGEDNND